jgi:hypothetical protein
MLFGLAALFSFASCQEKDPYAGNGKAPIIRKVFLEDGQSSVYDREVVFARLGQMIRIEGENLLGVVELYINGYKSIFNQTLMTDNSMLVQINTAVPVMDVDPEVKDKIRVVKRDGQEGSFSFEIRAAAPSISDVSHTMAQAGEEITIKGTNMHNAEAVLFPGDIAATTFTSDNEKGEWVVVVVPEGIATSGSVSVVGSNGTAVSPPYFNFKEGLLHNFDDVSNASWASGVDAATLTNALLPATGSGPKSQGSYNLFNAGGNLGNADQRYWLNSAVAGGIMGGEAVGKVIPVTTSVDLCGIQMDIYVEGEWNSGLIRMTMVDGMGDARGCMTWTPIYPGNKRDPSAFVNPGSWFTITMPFGSGADFATKTLGDVITQMAAAQFLQCGPWLENKASQLPDGESVTATGKIYFDNIRIVPLEAPATTDYPEPEDEEGGEEGAQ